MAKKETTAAPENEQGKTTATGARVLKKITVKEICGEILLKDIPETGVKWMAKIVGFAQGVKSGETQYGIWHAITGEFAATNMDTGEVFASATTIIPGALGDMLVQSVSAALHDDASAKVKFAVKVGVKISKRDKNKYEYEVMPLIDSQLASPALELLQLTLA